MGIEPTAYALPMKAPFCVVRVGVVGSRPVGGEPAMRTGLPNGRTSQIGQVVMMIGVGVDSGPRRTSGAFGVKRVRVILPVLAPVFSKVMSAVIIPR